MLIESGEEVRTNEVGMVRIWCWSTVLLCTLLLVAPRQGLAQDAASAPPTASGSPPTASDNTEGCVPVSDTELIEFNFEGADIREVIQGLAAGLCIHYSIDPRVQGTVTIRTASKLSGQDLFPLFHQILRTNGVAAVKVGEVYHIAPVGEAKTRVPLLTQRDERRAAASQDEFVIELVKVEYLAAGEMAEIIQPFVSPGGDVVAYPRGNLIILTDLASNVERLRELIAAFDTDTFRELHAQVYRIEHAGVEDIGEELASVLQPYGVTAQSAEERGVYIIPLLRLNSIVVIGFNNEIFSQVETWIKLLDVPPEKGGSRTVHVYAVENSKSADLADVLGDLYGGGGGRSSRSSRGSRGSEERGARGGRDRGSNRESGSERSSRGGGLGSGGSGGGLGRGGGRSGRSSRGSGTQSILIEPKEGETSVFKEEVRIVADESSNSLIILATPRDYEKIREVLVKLDVVPRQVLIEAIIAEVTLDDDLQFGIEWALANGGLSSTGGTGEEGGTAGGNAFDSGVLSEAKRAASIGSSGLFSFITDRDKFFVLLTAASAKSHVNILATPHVLAVDNQEAHILIGEEIPILTSTQQSTLATANIVSSIQYRDTGTILTILPQVNAAGLVNMEIRQEVSNVGVTSFGDTNSPSFTSRETETTVVVRHRESVLIGGIIDERIERSRSGVPFLMDIPVLGRLFRVEQDKRERTELIILITPYVIRDRNEAQLVTQEFTGRIHRLKKMIDSARRPSRDTPPSASAQEEIR